MFNLLKSLISGKAFPRIADLERAYLEGSTSLVDLERREVEMVKAVSQGYLTSLWNQDAFRKGKSELLNQIEIFTVTVIPVRSM